MHEDRLLGYQPGWYPDPIGAFDLRYYNGQVWTGDVSTGGERMVSPLPASGGPRRTATAALVLGVVALGIAWLPFFCVIGFALGATAVVLGLRRRHLYEASGASHAAIVTGAVAMIFAIAGMWWSVEIVRAVSAYEQPGRHEVSLESCGLTNGVTRAVGEVHNLERSTRSYTITVAFSDDSRRASIEIADVGPGERVQFVVDEDLRFDDLNCRVVSVKGPRPFGLAIDG